MDVFRHKTLVDINSLSLLGSYKEALEKEISDFPGDCYPHHSAFYWGKAGKKLDTPYSRWEILLCYNNADVLFRLQFSRFLLGKYFSRKFSPPCIIQKKDILLNILEGSISGSPFHEELKIILVEYSAKFLLCISRSSQAGNGRIHLTPMYQGLEEVTVIPKSNDSAEKRPNTL